LKYLIDAARKNAGASIAPAMRVLRNESLFLSALFPGADRAESLP
jgi:hypothetical protein